MSDYINARVLEEAEFMLETGGTVRSVAKKFGVSKSTVHKDVTERLPKINGNLYGEVHNLIEKNLNERHIRGGESTKKLWEGLRC